jgi:hypothetical protein
VSTTQSVSAEQVVRPDARLPTVQVPDVVSQVPNSVIVQATKSVLPQVERAPQLTEWFKHFRLRVPCDWAICLAVSWATQRTYCPWFFHGVTPLWPFGWPAHGQAAAIAACAFATAVGSQDSGAAMAIR